MKVSKALKLTFSSQDRSAPEAILVTGIAAVAAVGMFSGAERNLLPAEGILDALLVASFLLLATRVRRAALLVALAAASYVLVKLLLALLGSGAGILDFLQAYKAFIYLVLLAPFVSRRIFKLASLEAFLWVLIAIFLVKYSSSVFLGLDARPGVFTENNFEIPLLLGIYSVVFESLSRSHAWLMFGAISGIVLLGASRSSAVALVVVYIVLFFRATELRFVLVHVLVLTATTLGLNWIFETRAQGGSLSNTDRFEFLAIFANETRNWKFLDYILGSYPITPLSVNACKKLEYFQQLFSEDKPGHCYSVILHSYVLRSLFDHGVLGSVLLLSALVAYMHLSRTPRRVQLAILGAAIANAFSVSSFNNVFTVLVVLFALSADWRGVDGTRVQSGGFAVGAGTPSSPSSGRFDV